MRPLVRARLSSKHVDHQRFPNRVFCAYRKPDLPAPSPFAGCHYGSVSHVPARREFECSQSWCSRPRCIFALERSPLGIFHKQHHRRSFTRSVSTQKGGSEIFTALLPQDIRISASAYPSSKRIALGSAGEGCLMNAACEQLEGETQMK